jgi:hypothetical protein
MYAKFPHAQFQYSFQLSPFLAKVFEICYTASGMFSYRICLKGESKTILITDAARIYLNAICHWNSQHAQRGLQ